MADPVSETTSKEYDWKALVQEVEGERLKEKPIAYEFHGGKRVFRSREENGGVYTP